MTPAIFCILLPQTCVFYFYRLISIICPTLRLQVDLKSRGIYKFVHGRTDNFRSSETTRRSFINDSLLRRDRNFAARSPAERSTPLRPEGSLSVGRDSARSARGVQPA